MCRGKLSAAIAQLISKRLWSEWKWLTGVKEIPSPFLCCPVNRECSWKKTRIKKKNTSNFRVLRPKWPHPFLTTPTPIFFYQLSISMNLHQHVKNQVFSSFCSREIVDLQILQSDWPRAFWPMSQKPDFPEVWDFCKNTSINIHYFH